MTRYANQYGGGVFNNGPQLILQNTTIAENENFGNGGGAISYGTITDTNSNITGNSTYYSGGGLFSTGAFYSHNNIILSNMVTGGVPTNSEVVTGGGAYFYGMNLVGGSGATFNASLSIATENADLTMVFANTDAYGAGILADNGGQVRTVALLPDFANPAIDRGYLFHPD